MEMGPEGCELLPLSTGVPLPRSTMAHLGQQKRLHQSPMLPGPSVLP